MVRKLRTVMCSFRGSTPAEGTCAVKVDRSGVMQHVLAAQEYQLSAVSSDAAMGMFSRPTGDASNIQPCK